MAPIEARPVNSGRGFLVGIAGAPAPLKNPGELNSRNFGLGHAPPPSLVGRTTKVLATTRGKTKEHMVSRLGSFADPDPPLTPANRGPLLSSGGLGKAGPCRSPLSGDMVIHQDNAPRRPLPGADEKSPSVPGQALGRGVRHCHILQFTCLSKNLVRADGGDRAQFISYSLRLVELSNLGSGGILGCAKEGSGVAASLFFW